MGAVVLGGQVRAEGRPGWALSSLLAFAAEVWETTRHRTLVDAVQCHLRSHWCGCCRVRPEAR